MLTFLKVFLLCSCCAWSCRSHLCCSLSLCDNQTFQETDRIHARLQSMAIFFCLLFCSRMPTESSTIWMLKTHTDSAVFTHPCTHSNCGTPSTIRQSLMNGTDGICFALTPETECIEEFNARLRTLFLNNLTFMCKIIICKECMGRLDRLYFFGLFFFPMRQFSVRMKAQEITRETHGFCRSLFPLAKSL